MEIRMVKPLNVVEVQRLENGEIFKSDKGVCIKVSYGSVEDIVIDTFNEEYNIDCLVDKCGDNVGILAVSLATGKMVVLEPEDQVERLIGYLQVL